MEINKPVKSQLHEKWEDWMMEGEGIVNGKAKEPIRKIVTGWLVVVYTNIPEEMGKNAWNKTYVEWFSN